MVRCPPAYVSDYTSTIVNGYLHATPTDENNLLALVGNTIGDISDSSKFLPSRDYFAFTFILRNLALCVFNSIEQKMWLL